MGLWYINGSPNLGQKTRPYNNQQKKRIYKIIDFAVPADHKLKLKECGLRDKYLDLTRELKKLWNMKVKIIPLVIGAIGKVAKGLIHGLEDTIETSTLLRTTRIPRRVLEIWGDLLSLKFQWKTIRNRKDAAKDLEAQENYSK